MGGRARGAVIVRLAVDESSYVRHEIEPCKCAGARLVEPGDTCARCGRYPLAELIQAAASWYPPTTDELLRSFRGVDIET